MHCFVVVYIKYMRFRFWLWVAGVFILAIILWLGFFLVLTSYPKNWRYFKTFTTILIRNPNVLKGLFGYKFGDYPNPLPYYSTGTQNEKYTFDQLDTGKTWDVDKSYVVAKVVGVDLEKKEFSVVIILPKNKNFSDVQKSVRVECPSNETRVALKENRVVTDQRVDLFSTVAKNDLVLAYCSDDNCDTFTKACALIKMSSE